MIKTALGAATAASVILATASCGASPAGTPAALHASVVAREAPTARLDLASVPTPPADLDVVADRLRHHCRACHAVGTLRFIRSDDDQDLWLQLYKTRAPNSGKLWAEQIVRVLDWPSDAPPPFDRIMDPPDRDWMPRGAKRLSFASDAVEGEPVRRIIVDRLRRGLQDRP